MENAGYVSVLFTIYGIFEIDLAWLGLVLRGLLGWLGLVWLAWLGWVGLDWLGSLALVRCGWVTCLVRAGWHA